MINYGIKDVKGNSNKVVLKKAVISGNICGEFAEITINQEFENKGDTNVEAVYSFPLPKTSVISGFEATFGGRTIRAAVEDKVKAAKIYSDAEERGENTFLFEEFKPHEFQITVGRIIPNETIKIKLSYIDELEYRDGNFKLVIPALASPRKVGERGSEDEPDYKLSLNLLIESLCKLNFRSPYYDVNIEREGNTLSKINFYYDKVYMDRDFILIMKEEESVECSGMIYEYKDEGEDRGIIYLRLVSDLDVDEEEEKHENYIFLIDITESMRGAKLEEAKNAVQLCLRNLSEGDTFDIVAMGNELKFFSEEGSLPFNEDNLSEASEWIDDLNAYGNTLIYNAIKYSLEGKNKDAYNTILLFTDDMVESENEILAYVKDNIGNSRIFAFGIDSSANTYFIDKLARLGYGKAEFIDEEERIEEAVLRQFKRIEDPEVDDIKIDWGKMQIDETFPRTIDYMYDREPFSIFGRSLNGIEGEITIRGKVGNKDYVKKVNFDNFELEENANLIQKVWCRKRIHSLEERMLGARGEEKQEMREKVIQVSKKYGIVSPETSFLVIEDREEPVMGIQLKSIIPLKVYEKNLSEKAFKKSGDYPSFLYKTYVDTGLGKGNEFLDYKYPREKILIILAKNQFADGSFYNIRENDLKSKLMTTSLTLAAFSLGEEDITIYINQLNKAVEFLIKNYDEVKQNEDDVLQKTMLAALKLSTKKRVLKAKNSEKIRSILFSEEDMNAKIQIISLFSKSEDGISIEQEIIIGKEKDSINGLAKLAILKALTSK